MTDQVLIEFQSKNAQAIVQDLKSMAVFADMAHKAVMGLNAELARMKGAGLKTVSQSVNASTTAIRNQSAAMAQNRTQAAGYKRDAGEIRGHNEGMARSISSARNALLLYAFTTAAVVREIKKLLDASMQWEASLMRTERLLITTNGISGKTAEGLAELAEVMGVLTLESSKGVLDAANAMLTFKNVTGDTFDRALESASDLASLGFGNMKTAAIQLGKALEDPAVGLASLRRVGVSFSKEQQKNIKLLIKQNQLFTAQDVILGALEGQTKGTAKAAAQGLAGALDTASEAAERLRRQLGEGGLGQAIGFAAKQLAKLYDTLAKIDSVFPALSGAITFFTSVLVVALGGVLIFLIHKVITAIKLLIAGWLGAGASAQAAGYKMVAALLPVQVQAKKTLASLILVKTSWVGLGKVALKLGMYAVLFAAVGMLMKIVGHIKAAKLAMEELRQRTKDAADGFDTYIRALERANTALGKQTLTQGRFDDVTDQIKATEEELKKLLNREKELRQYQEDHPIAAFMNLSRLEYQGLGDAIVEVGNRLNELTGQTQTYADVLKEVGRSATFESLIVDIQEEDEEILNLLDSIKLLEAYKKRLQGIRAPDTPLAFEAYQELSNLGVSDESIFLLDQANVKILSLDERIKKLRKQTAVSTPQMELLLDAVKTFGIEVSKDFELGSIVGDMSSFNLMFERQKAIREEQEQLNALRQVGLVTQTEAIRLQAELNEKLLETKESSKMSDEVIRGMKLGIARMMQETQSLGEIVATSVEDVFDGLGQAVEQFFKTGKVEWKALAASILADLAKMLLQKAILTAISAFGGAAAPAAGAAESGVMAVGLAGGGTYQAGVPRLVGERGPELEIPSTSGRIVNNTQMNARGLNDQVRQDIRIINAVDSNAVWSGASNSTIDKVIINAISRNSGAMRGLLA